MSVSHGQPADFAELLPVPAGAKLVLVFGGTFDPPHRAHVELPEQVRRKLGADWILYVPAARSPLRARNPVAPGRDRLAMLRLALAGRANCAVSPIELIASDDANGESAADAAAAPSYTVDTLRKLRVLLPHGAAMRLLIGADQAAVFHQWRQAREVIALAEPAVMLRAPHESPERLIEAMTPHWPPEELAKWRGRMVEVPAMDVSATEIRAALASRDAPGRAIAERDLHPDVLAYIRRNCLYEAR